VELFPSIDVRAGRVVRLVQGDYNQETVYGEDPVEVAVAFADAGAHWIHVVDLDAARTGDPLNRPVIAAIAAAVAPRRVAIQTGGGVRTEGAAESLWAVGVRRVVVGTAAVEDPGLVARLGAAKPGGVAVGLDSRDGEVVTRGWLSGSGLGVAEMINRVVGEGVGAVIVTDVGRDGMLRGPDLTGLEAVLDATAVDVIASGGVSSGADIAALAALRGPATARALAGVIVGKAIYEGRVTVAEGVAVCAASG
jgi:phosphoribosylformimino-5-aminoimidazole carboxamide ribotide isomerase